MEHSARSSCTEHGWQRPVEAENLGVQDPIKKVVKSGCNASFMLTEVIRYVGMYDGQSCTPYYMNIPTPTHAVGSEVSISTALWSEMRSFVSYHVSTTVLVYGCRTPACRKDVPGRDDIRAWIGICCFAFV
jgi:hypothetical protein